MAGMVTISITAQAFEAIKALLPVSSKADTRPEGKGGFHITLPRDVLGQLKLIRESGEPRATLL
jgi:hypothetical protein